MKRDWNLLRWILNEVESCEGYPIILSNGGVTYVGDHYSLDIGERNFNEVREHMLLLGDSGLAEVRNLSSLNSAVALDRLTMAGHDFLDAAKDENRWTEALKITKEKGGTITVGILIQVLSALMKQSFGL